LFIEKEGFAPLFKSSGIAERFDIAVMSTKGMSVVAARALVDKMCSDMRKPKRGAFVREGEFRRWLGRVAEDKDGAAWLVAMAITDAIRNRSKPGDGIRLGRLCELTNMQPNIVVGIINRLRKRGRLQFTRTSDRDIASRF
jgi:hypothetical protein